MSKIDPPPPSRFSVQLGGNLSFFVERRERESLPEASMPRGRGGGGGGGGNAGAGSGSSSAAAAAAEGGRYCCIPSTLDGRSFCRRSMSCTACV